MLLLLNLLTISFLSFAANRPANISLAITVDDLPAHGQLPPGVSRLQVTEKMLAIFKKHGVPEVYGFINGERLDRNPELAAVFSAWRSAGYPLANHTSSHPHLRASAVEDFESDVLANEVVLKTYMGNNDWKFFRYPYLDEGNTAEKHEQVRSFLMDHHYQIAQVTVDFEDWSWNDPYARCVRTERLDKVPWLKKTYLKNARSALERAVKITDFLYHRPVAHILLLHVGAFDAEVLDALLTDYEKRGAKFIGLHEAVADPMYSSDPHYVGRFGSELTYQILKQRGLKLSDAGLRPYREYPGRKLAKLCPPVI